MSSLTKYLNVLKNDLAKFDLGEEINEQNSIQFLYCYYHYFNADQSKYDDVLSGETFKNSNNDKITGIYVDEESDNNDVDILLFLKSDLFLVPAIFKYIVDAENEIFSKEKRSEIMEVLKKYGLNSLEDQSIKIRVITDLQIGAPLKRTIEKSILTLKAIHKNVAYEVVTANEIEMEILEIENPKEYVELSTFIIDKNNNFLEFGEEKSIIVNISAISLRHCYQENGFRGLFSQNLRYYVKNSKIDDSINLSMKNNPDDFWYKNNGVIVICDDYRLGETNITLYNFSIINGGQTTKLIGESDFEKDFFVQCKIIKNTHVSPEEKIEFIANVAEASNTQKPIKEKDLVANKPEQRLLKKQLAENGIYCQIKRGEKVNKKLYPNPWQNTTNEEIGQFLLSFMYQKPGTARTNKSSICSNQERYNLIFCKEYASDLIRDLLKIKAYYKMWIKDVKKLDDASDQYKIGLVNNGMLFVVATIGLISKYYFRNTIATQINNLVNTEDRMELVSQYDISHGIFADCIDKKQMYALFEYVYKKFYRVGFEYLKSFKPSFNSYSNFTKTNSNYNLYVFKTLSLYFSNGIPGSDLSFLDTIMYKASDCELKRNEEIIKKYVNVISTNIDGLVPVDDEVSKTIYDKLIDYRTKAYKKRHIKAYEVFKNVSAERISKYAPDNIEDLTSLRCLDEYQLSEFGEEIIKIIKDTI